MKPTVIPQAKTIIAHYNTHEQAENAIIRLQKQGYEMNQFSIIATDLYTAEKVLGFYGTFDRMKHWAAIGGFYSGFWGLLFGFSTYAIPVIGPSLVQGWIGAIVAGLALGIIGAILNAVAAALYGFFRNQKKVKYQTDVRAANYLVLAEENVALEDVREVLQLHIPKQKYECRDWRAELKAK